MVMQIVDVELYNLQEILLLLSFVFAFVRYIS